MSDAEPEFEAVRAIDVRPYRWGVWCSIEGGEPFVNVIESRKWSDDGQGIWFCLGSHNFLSAKPAEKLKLVLVDPSKWAPVDNQEEFLAQRPTPTIKCSACGGRGKVEAER
jgi:hypothetical protein